MGSKSPRFSAGALALTWGLEEGLETGSYEKHLSLGLWSPDVCFSFSIFSMSYGTDYGFLIHQLRKFENCLRTLKKKRIFMYKDKLLPFYAFPSICCVHTMIWILTEDWKVLQHMLSSSPTHFPSQKERSCRLLKFSPRKRLFHFTEGRLVI